MLTLLHARSTSGATSIYAPLLRLAALTRALPQFRCSQFGTKRSPVRIWAPRPSIPLPFIGLQLSSHLGERPSWEHLATKSRPISQQLAAGLPQTGGSERAGELTAAPPPSGGGRVFSFFLLTSFPPSMGNTPFGSSRGPRLWSVTPFPQELRLVIWLLAHLAVWALASGSLIDTINGN